MLQQQVLPTVQRIKLLLSLTAAAVTVRPRYLLKFVCDSVDRAALALACVNVSEPRTCLSGHRRVLPADCTVRVGTVSIDVPAAGTAYFPGLANLASNW